MSRHVRGEAILTNNVRITLTREDLVKVLTDMASQCGRDKITMDIRVWSAEYGLRSKASISFNNSFGTLLESVEQNASIEWEE